MEMAVRWLVWCILLSSFAAAGCSPGVRASDNALLRAMHDGEFGIARSIAMRERTTDISHKRALLDSELVLWTALAEGDMSVAGRAADEVYDGLRVQGVNRGTDAERFLVGDQAARTWKGEPFEQAAAFAAVAITDGVRGDWGNLRAAAAGSVFQLRELSEIESEQENGVRFVASDFEPGYALAAIAERQLGLHAEMEESLRALESVNPELVSVAERIRSGVDNTAFVIDYGHAPARVPSGEDGSIATYRQRTPSGTERLDVSIDGHGVGTFPVMTDYNRLALDLKWTRLEDQRRAKSAIGSGLLYGGIGVAAVSDDGEVQLAGLGAALAGLALKATAQADTRQCVAVPQRSYLALATLPQGLSWVAFDIGGVTDSPFEVPVMRSDDAFQMHYIRIAVDEPLKSSPPEIRYANDASGPIGQPTLPWVLGGRCVRVPRRELLAEYRLAGLPDWVTLDDLRAMYEEEGFAITGFGSGDPDGVHVLEGGEALYTPKVGSAGFVRLFCRSYPSYVPRGELAIQILDDIR